MFFNGTSAARSNRRVHLNLTGGTGIGLTILGMFAAGETVTDGSS